MDNMESKPGATPPEAFNSGEVTPPNPESPRSGFRVEARQPDMLYLLAKAKTSETAKTIVWNLHSRSVLSETEIQNDILGGERTFLAGRNDGTFFYETELKPSKSWTERKDRGFYSTEKIQRIREMLSNQGLNAVFESSYDGRNYVLIEKNGYYVDVSFGWTSPESVIEGLQKIGRTKFSEEEVKSRMKDTGSGAYMKLVDKDKIDRSDMKEGLSALHLKDENDFINATTAYRGVYEQVVKAIYAEEGKPPPKASVMLRPPIEDLDELTKIKSVETTHPTTVTPEQLKPEAVGFDEIAGQDEAVEQAKRLVLAINHPEVFERRGVKRPKGILFYGPPGTGKTMIAKAVANEADAEFLSVSAADIGAKYYGESENLMQKVFDNANAAVARGRKVILFFDEIDSLAPSRAGDAHEVTKKVVATMLQNMDGMKANPNVTIIAASNRPEDIDTAFKRPGRIDKLIYVGLPSEEGRKATLKVHMEKARKSASQGEELFSSDIDLEYLAGVTNGMSGADLASLVNLTLEEKTMAELEGKPWTPVTTEEIDTTAKKLNVLKETKRKLGFALPSSKNEQNA